MQLTDVDRAQMCLVKGFSRRLGLAREGRGSSQVESWDLEFLRAVPLPISCTGNCILLSSAPLCPPHRASGFLEKLG